MVVARYVVACGSEFDYSTVVKYAGGCTGTADGGVLFVDVYVAAGLCE